MFCTNCGKEIPDNAVVCTACGCLVNGERAVSYCTQEQQQGNGMAIAGFVCSFFVPLLGWIFGGIGLSRSAKRNGKGKAFSIAALAIASVGFVLNMALLF
ncbi:MAG: zinc ribbon domain-containing protein [Clostridia bacterium]|nr:zinc ribbon domain-containing protein [Clostridia bacterium]